jgi:HAMP domain-containing protein
MGAGRNVMPWIASTDVDLEFPYAIWAKISRAAKIRREDVMQALTESQRIHNEAIKMSARINELELEVSRLRRENEFMLKVINGSGS